MTRRNYFDDAAYESLNELFLSKRKIPEHQLLNAIDSENLLAHYVAYNIVTEAYRRIHPEPELLRIGEFLLDYYLGCIEREPLPEPKTTEELIADRPHTRYEAAWELPSWLDNAWRHRPETDSLIADFVERITDLFLKSDEETRTCIETAFLEHALERPALRPLFAHWEQHPQLSDAHRQAMLWAVAHERPRK
jgi:hypothetical protein